MALAEARLAPSRRKRFALTAAVVAGAATVLCGHRAFAGASLKRLDACQRQLQCAREYAYGEVADRIEWQPRCNWKGQPTYFLKRAAQADEHRPWIHLDADGKMLYPFAQHVKALLLGEDNPLWSPEADTGAFVVVTNCEKIRVSGTMYHDMLFFRNGIKIKTHTKVERFKDLQQRLPERIIMTSVWASMPKGKGARRMFKERLKLFEGPNHLYYHMNPKEYPNMHNIPDVSADTRFKVKERLWHKRKVKVPQLLERQEKKQAKEDNRRLTVYKELLLQQIDELGDEAAKDITMEDLLMKAEMNRYERVLREGEGKEPEPQPIGWYRGRWGKTQRIKPINLDKWDDLEHFANPPTDKALIKKYNKEPFNPVDKYTEPHPLLQKEGPHAKLEDYDPANFFATPNGV